MSTDYTRGDDPVYDGYRETWKSQREQELESEIEELNAELAQNGWVQCDEWIPDECVEVMVYSYYEDDKACIFLAYYNNGEWINGDSGDELKRVTHWMHLPKPPNGGQING